MAQLSIANGEPNDATPFLPEQRNLKTLKDARRGRRIPLLLGLYEQYGPIFSIRGLHRRGVIMLGPEANHYITISGAGGATSGGAPSRPCSARGSSGPT